MEKKSRKLLSRIGAALMLGLSLFNFGAAWSKLKGGFLPKRARNIRKQTKQEIDPETQEVATIAEQEAQNVLMTEEMEESEKQQQLQEDSMTAFQKGVRYVAITAWAVAAGFVFTSVVFNYPFEAGKALLSLLPGEPHVVSVSLATHNEYFQVGDEIQIDTKLNTNGEIVSQLKLVLEYDPGQLQFENFELNEKYFNQIEQQKIDEERGEITVALASTQQDVATRNEVVSSLYFTGVEKSSQCKIDIDQDDSVVIKQKGGKPFNVLGKVTSADFKILEKRNPSVACSYIDAGEEIEPWELLAKGAVLPNEGTAWNEVGSEWAFICGHKEERLYLLFTGNQQQLESIKFEFEHEKESSAFASIEKKWQENEQFFFGAVINEFEKTQEVFESVRGVKFTVNTPSSSLRWPRRGSAVFVLQ